MKTKTAIENFKKNEILKKQEFLNDFLEFLYKNRSLMNKSKAL